MAKYAHADVLDGGLNAIRNNATQMLLLKAYSPGDSYATVVGTQYVPSPCPPPTTRFPDPTARRGCSL